MKTYIADIYLKANSSDIPNQYQMTVEVEAENDKEARNAAYEHYQDYAGIPLSRGYLRIELEVKKEQD